MILFGWVLLGIEALCAAFFAFVFWHFWTRSAMTRPTAVRALTVYVLGALACLLLMVFLPV